MVDYKYHNFNMIILHRNNNNNNSVVRDRYYNDEAEDDDMFEHLVIAEEVSHNITDPIRVISYDTSH